MQEGNWLLGGAGASYRIAVPWAFHETAKEIDSDAPDTDEDRDDVDWNPQDATVEVWSQRSTLRTGMIKASLRENGIHYRAEIQDDGCRKIFVAPRNEPRAREIVREIETASPPI